MLLRSPLSIVFACLVALAVNARASGPDAVADRTRAFVLEQALPAGDVEIVVGSIDPRLSLAPCARFEPFVPPGARLWGRATLGVRCVDGAAWTVYVPVHVKVFAPVQVAARPIPRGTNVAADDVRTERVDITQYAAGVYGPDDALESKTAVRMIAAGEPIRRDMLRAPRIVEPGDAVRVVYDGASFSVTVDGKALSSAADGETARVAIASGRVLTGVARAGKVVVVR
jgi:flagella basal body P-ring formation protein FlgA